MTTTEPTRYSGYTLEELQALEQAATAGPWSWQHTRKTRFDYLRNHKHLIIMDFARRGMQGAQPRFRHPTLDLMVDAQTIQGDPPPDARIMAAARNALPDLIAEVRRLQAENNELQALRFAIETLGDTGDFECTYEYGAWTATIYRGKEATADTPVAALLALAKRIKEVNDG